LQLVAFLLYFTMSAKRHRRRNRKSKSKKEGKIEQNYEDKFICIEESGIHSTIFRAYMRQSAQHLFTVVPTEVHSICFHYFDDEKQTLQDLDAVIPQITDIWYDGFGKNPKDNVSQTAYKRFLKQQKDGTLKIKHCVLKFNHTFTALSSYEKRLLCRRILRQKVYPIHKLVVYPPPDPDPAENANTADADIEAEKSRNFVTEQLFFTEYILCKRYSTLQTLDVSELDLNDEHLLYLCTAIENLIRYNTQRKEKKLQAKLKQIESNEDSNKHSQQQPSPKKKKRSKKKDGDEQIQAKIFGRDSKAVHQILEQQRKMKEEAMKNQKTEPVKMKLKEINLSYNSIGDRYLPLLLRAIKNHLPDLKLLDLSVTQISNASLPCIIKYDIRRLMVDLSGCTAVTLKELGRYKRTEMFDEERPDKYVYCKDMVYFVNEQEEKQEHRDQSKGGKRIRGKGRKFRANRKRTLYTGRDGIETGYVSDCCGGDFWDYA